MLVAGHKERNLVLLPHTDDAGGENTLAFALAVLVFEKVQDLHRGVIVMNDRALGGQLDMGIQHRRQERRRGIEAQSKGDRDQDRHAIGGSEARQRADSLEAVTEPRGWR